MYEVLVDIENLHPHLYDEDPVQIWKYYVAAYINRVEFTQGLKQGDNISLFISWPEKSVISYRSLGPVQ
jgi:hypothetical protein